MKKLRILLAALIAIFISSAAPAQSVSGGIYSPGFFTLGTTGINLGSTVVNIDGITNMTFRPTVAGNIGVSTPNGTAADFYVGQGGQNTWTWRSIASSVDMEIRDAVAVVLKLHNGGNATLTGILTAPSVSISKVTFTGFTFANIGTNLTTDGQMGYCSDCTIASPCAGAGTGAIAKRLNGVQVCN